MKTILIIEDNALIRENTAELLELNNYDVLVAENGKCGFELAKKYTPDIILCDMRMPDANGYEFLQLAKQNPAVRDIPLIFFSAGSLFLTDEKGLIKAAKGYLQKPFTEEDLVKSISIGLNKNGNNREIG